MVEVEEVVDDSPKIQAKQETYNKELMPELWVRLLRAPLADQLPGECAFGCGCLL